MVLFLFKQISLVFLGISWAAQPSFVHYFPKNSKDIFDPTLFLHRFLSIRENFLNFIAIDIMCIIKSVQIYFIKHSFSTNIVFKKYKNNCRKRFFSF